MADTEHSDTPIQFSQELVDSLQASSEVNNLRTSLQIGADRTQTNSTRAKTLDLHIAQRVHEELEKIQKHESSRLEEIRSKIASGTEDKPKDTKTSKGFSLLELPSISPKDLFQSEPAEEKERKAQTSQKVQGEIEKLKKALGERKVLKEIPEPVDKARGDVIACLRINDRQPLDCWKEVEIFKREVRKMEEKYVGSML